LENVQAVTNPDGSVTLSAVTDHFTLFTVVTDPADAIRPGPADPLEEVSLRGLRSYGLDPYSAQTESREQSNSDISASNGLSTTALVAIGIVAAIILTCLAAATVYLKRRRT